MNKLKTEKEAFDSILLVNSDKIQNLSKMHAKVTSDYVLEMRRYAFDMLCHCDNYLFEKARAANEPVHLPPCKDTECTYNNGKCAIDGCGGYRNEG